MFRHGEPIEEYHQKYVGHLDVPLSEIGKKQARKIRNSISLLRNPTVITSDLQRTFSELNLPLEQKKELREINFGDWDGLSWDDVLRLFPQDSKLFMKRSDHFTFPKGESYAQFTARIISQFDKILDQSEGDLVFIVHAGVIRTIISTKFNIPLPEVFNFKIDYGKCTVLERTNSHLTLLSLNESTSSGN